MQIKFCEECGHTLDWKDYKCLNCGYDNTNYQSMNFKTVIKLLAITCVLPFSFFIVLAGLAQMLKTFDKMWLGLLAFFCLGILLFISLSPKRKEHFLLLGILGSGLLAISMILYSNTFAIYYPVTNRLNITLQIYYIVINFVLCIVFFVLAKLWNNEVKANYRKVDKKDYPQTLTETKKLLQKEIETIKKRYI